MVLFIPLNLLSLALLGLILTGLTYAVRNTVLATARELWTHLRSQSPLSTACFLIFLFMILTLNAGPVIMDDTHSYHIQMVKWIQEYGTVKGIANLHLRFGFNSSWFIAIGLLSPEMAGPGHYLALNGLLSCWFCYYLLQKSFSFSYTGVAAAVILAIGILVWPMIRGSATSANYDFISTCSILFLLLESAESSQPMLWPEWILWPCYLLTVRIINAPLLLLSVFAVVCYCRKSSTPWPWLIISALLFIPFLIRNTLLSGYLLFPLYQFDFFSIDWKADQRELMQITEYIKYYNRSNSHIELVTQLSSPGWLPVWFKQLFLYDKILVTMSAFAWAAVGLQWKKWPPYSTPVFKGLIITLILSILFWLMAAPDPRFGYGFLLAGPCLLILLFSRHSSLIAGRYITGTILACLTIGIFVYTIRKIRINPAYRNLVSPYPLPVPTFKEIWVDGIELRIPNKVLDNWNPRCYDLPLPCLYRVNPRLHARGKDLRDGFRLEGPVLGINPDLPVGPDNPAEFNGEYKRK